MKLYWASPKGFELGWGNISLWGSLNNKSKEIWKAFACLLISDCILVKVTGVGVNTEWGQVMASISEDNGEETPLQVWGGNLLETSLSYYSGPYSHELFFTDTLLDSFALGSAEWYCYTHWQSWFKYCSTCFYHPGHQVQYCLLVF